MGKTQQRIAYIESVRTLALTYNKSRQHERDSERGLRGTAVLPETLRQGTDCIVQSYRTHTCDKVLRAQLQHDHLKATAHTSAHVYTGPQVNAQSTADREERTLIKSLQAHQQMWIGHILRHDSLLRKVTEGKKTRGMLQCSRMNNATRPLDGQEWQPKMSATERNDTMRRRLVSLVYHTAPAQGQST